MNSKSNNDLDANLVAYQDLFSDVDMNGFMKEVGDLENRCRWCPACLSFEEDC